ncbi:MAG TPA: phosphotransferase [Sandaracinaceae bacterium LLY-WYZ-13_1]|nr:phosphotransferase [Sandaracinaceae bacterium LLY-WYZ-13_1]
MEALRERLGALGAHPEYGRILRAITERSTPGEVADAARELTHRLAGEAPARSLFATVSVGAVVGWELSSGERAVLKWHAPGAALELLGSQYGIMDALARDGVPCPRRLAGPVAAGRGAAVLLSWLPAERVPLPRARRCRASARTLARVIEAIRALDVAPSLPPPRPETAPFPTPHAVVFDFEATTEGGEAIDAIGRWTAAELASDPGEEVVAHGDWTAHNVLMDEDARVRAIYDWDSVERMREPVAVGSAAVAFGLDGRSGGDFSPPDAASSLAFIDAYRAASGRLETPDERRATRIAALRTFAYLARCQHAIATARGHAPYPFVQAIEAYRRGVL